jgi:hypothetical protein
MKRLFDKHSEELESYSQHLEQWQRTEPDRFRFIKSQDLRRLAEVVRRFLADTNKKSFFPKWGKFYDSVPSVMGLTLPGRRSESFEDESDEESPDHLPSGYYEVGQGPDFSCGTRTFRDVWDRAAPKQKFSGTVESEVRLHDIWEEFEPIHKAGNVSVRDKCRAFRMCLTGAAEQATRSFKRDDDEI